MYYAHPAGTNLSGFTHVATLTVDPGTYLVTTSVTVTTGPSSAFGWQAICGIGTGNGTYVARAEGNASQGSMSLAPVAVIATTGTLVLDCTANVTPVGTMNGHTHLTAVAVNAL